VRAAMQAEPAWTLDGERRPDAQSMSRIGAFRRMSAARSPHASWQGSRVMARAAASSLRIDEVIDFIEEHGDSALRGALMLWLIHLRAGGGAQHPGVDLDRSLPKGVPIDHARPVNEIEHMAEIEAAVSQVGTARWRDVGGQLVAPGAGQDVNRDCTGALQADAGERSGERLVMRFRERR